jgi:hypothetical protein
LQSAGAAIGLLFDHLIGAHENGGRYLNPERLGSVSVSDAQRAAATQATLHFGDLQVGLGLEAARTA